MLFVTRYSNYTVVLRNGLYRRGENELGQIITETVRPDLNIDFIPRAMTEAQRIIAVKMFTAINPESPWGAVPYEVDGTMGQEFGDLIMDVERYSGYNPAFSMSKYDTRTDIPYEAQLAETDEQKAELKSFVETTLMSIQSFNQDYIRLDEALPKPWPAYSSTGGPGHHKAVIRMAKDFGISMADLVEFEKTQDKPAAGIIAEAELEIAKAKADEAERAALGAVIS